MTGHLLVRTATGPVDASVDVPASKSIANRALVCAALADGRSTIEGLPAGDDTAALVECLALLGIQVEVTQVWAAVDGRGGILPPGPLTLPARLAGTTSRFVTALAALGTGPYVVDGDSPLRTRPMGPLHRSAHSRRRDGSRSRSRDRPRAATSPSAVTSRASS